MILCRLTLSLSKEKRLRCLLATETHEKNPLSSLTSTQISLMRGRRKPKDMRNNKN